jgi:hypothetical protein
MKTMVVVCLMAIALVRAASTPLAGVWEGSKDGRKAVAVTVREREGILGGTVVLYIVHDDHDGSLDGTPLDPETMKGTSWDGKMLRFEAGVAKFELRPVGGNKAELKCIAPAHTETLEVVRHGER